MNKNILLIIMLLTLLFGRVNNIISQEWETVYYNDPDVSRCYYNEAIELSNGNILVTSISLPRNMNNDPQYHFYHSMQPLLSLFSPDGDEIYRNEYDYFKPGLSIETYPYLFEKNGEMYFLTAYNPDHDINSKNYFKNQDNIPTESIIGLYKLDEMLNIAESYEHSYPIDTFERRDEDWYYYLNLYCGYIYIYSAFEEDGHITGSYIKNESRRYTGYDDYNDSVFFFKMDFDGNFLVRKGYEIDTVCGYAPGGVLRQQMIKNDDGYQGDALAFLSRCREKFDLIFLDPPYDSGLLEKAMELITTIDIVSENGIIVCENGSNSVWPVVAEPYRMQKEYRYGKIRTALYRRNAE